MCRTAVGTSDRHSGVTGTWVTGAHCDRGVDSERGSGAGSSVTWGKRHPRPAHPLCHPLRRKEQESPLRTPRGTVGPMVRRVYTQEGGRDAERRRGPHRFLGAAVPRHSLWALLVPWRCADPRSSPIATCGCRKCHPHRSTR
jgi:hypothetical protein